MIAFVTVNISGCSSCRSLLADIVQQEDAKELCRILVLVSGEAAKSYSGMADSKFRFPFPLVFKLFNQSFLKMHNSWTFALKLVSTICVHVRAPDVTSSVLLSEKDNGVNMFSFHLVSVFLVLVM